MQYRPDLDGIRAIAVILVLLYHATFPLPGAFLGVDIFFTLSGFLITTLTTTSLRENTFTLSSFYIRRSLRLIPAAITVTTITALAALTLLPLHSAHQTLVSSIAATASVSNIRYLLQSGYFDSEAITKPLLHTWSLAVEEQFYLVWPFLLVFSHRYLHPRAPLIFASIIVIISPYLSHLLIQTHPAAAFYLAPARFYELLLGAALSFVPPPSSFLIHQAFGFAGFLGLFLSVAFISAADEFPSWRALAPCISTALLINAGPRSLVSKFLSIEPLVFIGTISYSVYLVHWPVVVFYRLLTAQRGVFGMGERLFMLGAAFLLGYPLNALVEKQYRLAKGAKSLVGNSPHEKTADVNISHNVNKNSSHSRHACRRLVAVMIFVQLGLFLAVGLLNGQENLVGLSLTKEHPMPSRNVSHSSADDYNEFDIESVFRLSSEVNEAVGGRLRKPVMGRFGSKWFFENGSVPKGYVEKTNPDIPRILFIGDSHALHWKSLMYHISKEFSSHVEMWWGRGCAPLFEAFNVFLRAPQRTEPCRHALENWKAQLLAKPFDTVVLSGRWAWLVENDFYGAYDFERRGHFLVEETAPKEKRTPPRDKAEWAAVYNESRRVFRKSLLSTVSLITGLGSRVVLMSQVPVLKKDPRDCTSHPRAKEAIAVGRQPEECVSVTRKQVFSRLEYVSAVANEVKSIYGKMVDVVFPTDVFCDNFLQDNEWCRVVIKDKVLYRDPSHLNEFGASFFTMRWRAMGYGGVPWTFTRAPKR